MLRRAFLILVILAGLGSGGVAYYQWSYQIPALIQQRNAEKSEKDGAVAAHNKTKAELKTAVADLSQGRQELANTKSDQQKELARVNAQEKRAGDLDVKLANVNGDLQGVQNLLAEYKASGLKAEEVVKLKSNLNMAQMEIAGISAERDLWQRRQAIIEKRLSYFEELYGVPPVILPSDLKGNIAVVDPKWDFVVLNIGEKDHAVQNGELLISRQGKLVAKVVIRSVEKDQCTADIVPHWKFGELLEGDLATPAYPSGSIAMAPSIY
jgi:hypothetical protein